MEARKPEHAHFIVIMHRNCVRLLRVCHGHWMKQCHTSRKAMTSASAKKELFTLGCVRVLHAQVSVQSSGHCDATNIGYKDHTEAHGLDRDTPYYRRFNKVFQYARVPFGALVHFIPSSKDWQLQHCPKADPTAIPGLFLGYSFGNQGTFRQKYRFLFVIRV